MCLFVCGDLSAYACSVNICIHAGPSEHVYVCIRICRYQHTHLYIHVTICPYRRHFVFTRPVCVASRYGQYKPMAPKPREGGATVVRSRAGICMYMHVYVSTYTFIYTHMQKPRQGGATVVRSRAGDTNVILVNQRLGHGWYNHLYDPAPDVAGVAGCIECAGGGLGPGPSSTASRPSSFAGVGGAGDAGTGWRLCVAEKRARASGVSALVAQCVSDSVFEDHPRDQDH